MTQADLFDVDYYDALRSVVIALGGSKVVGAKLRPEKSPDDAARWCNNCLDKKRRDKFDIDDVLRMLRAARRVAFHDGINFFAAWCGYQPPIPKSAQEEERDLGLQIVEGQKRLEALYIQVGRLREQEKAEW